MSSSKRNPSAGAGTDWLAGWHVSPTFNKDYDIIDGLRGLAILMVVACHLVYFNPEAGVVTRFIGGIFGAGAYGVTLFFTLSGFLISYPFWKRKVAGNTTVAPPGYAGRRFWKIYPPLFLSILLLTPLYFVFGASAPYWSIAGQWLIGWPIVGTVSGHFNPVMWSLVVEVQFYIILPLLFLCLKRLPARTCLWLVFSLLLFVPTAYRWWGLSHGQTFQLHPEIQLHFPSLLDGFAFGVLLAGMENLRWIKKTWARLGDLGCLLFLLTLVASAWFGLSGKPTAIQVELTAWGMKIASALLLCYIADPAHPRTRLLSRPWLRWCGLISYEWYLFHQPVHIWARSVFGATKGDVLKYGAIVGGSLLIGLAVATLIYRYFSLPILKFGRSRHPTR